MTEKEKLLAANLLEMAAEQFANQTCNDIPEELFEGWTQKEKENLCKYYEKQNSGGLDYEKGDVIQEDWIAMYAMAYKLRGL